LSTSLRQSKSSLSVGGGGGEKIDRALALAALAHFGV